MSEIRDTLTKFRDCIINRGPECITTAPAISECNVIIVPEPTPDPILSGLQIQLYYAGAGEIVYPKAPFDMRPFYLGVAIFYTSFCEGPFQRSSTADFVLEISDCVRDLILFANLDELLTLPHQLSESGLGIVDEAGKTWVVHQMLFQCTSYPRHFDDLVPCDCFQGDCVDPDEYGGS